MVRAGVGLVAVLLAGAAAAQDGNPAMVTPGTPEQAPGKPAPHTVNTADRVFLQQAAIGGMAEVALAELVVARSREARVEAFADRMKTDHGKANAELKQIAEAAGVALPGEPDAEHRAIQERLEQLSGREFDLAYLGAQLTDHQKSAQLLAYVIGSGQDPVVKDFAAASLPIILEHLRMVQELQAELAGKTA